MGLKNISLDEGIQTPLEDRKLQFHDKGFLDDWRR